MRDECAHGSPMSKCLVCELTAERDALSTNLASERETRLMLAEDGLRLKVENRSLSARVAALEGALDRDQTGLAHALNACKTEIGRRGWILDGRGSYEWDDQRYRDEARWAFEAVVKIIDAALKASGDNALALLRPAEGEGRNENKVPGASRTPLARGSGGIGSSPEGDGIPAPTGTNPAPRSPAEGEGVVQSDTRAPDDELPSSERSPVVSQPIGEGPSIPPPAPKPPLSPEERESRRPIAPAIAMNALHGTVHATPAPKPEGECYCKGKVPEFTAHSRTGCGADDGEASRCGGRPPFRITRPTGGEGEGEGLLREVVKRFGGVWSMEVGGLIARIDAYLSRSARGAK